jgi:hypothetical protein
MAPHPPTGLLLQLAKGGDPAICEVIARSRGAWAVLAAWSTREGPAALAAAELLAALAGSPTVGHDDSRESGLRRGYPCVVYCTPCDTLAACWPTHTITALFIQ